MTVSKATDQLSAAERAERAGPRSTHGRVGIQSATASAWPPPSAQGQVPSSKPLPTQQEEAERLADKTIHLRRGSRQSGRLEAGDVTWAPRPGVINADTPPLIGRNTFPDPQQVPETAGSTGPQTQHVSPISTRP